MPSITFVIDICSANVTSSSILSKYGNDALELTASFKVDEDDTMHLTLKVLRNGINDLMNLFKKQGLAEDSTSTWCRIKH